MDFLRPHKSSLAKSLSWIFVGAASYAFLGCTNSNMSSEMALLRAAKNAALTNTETTGSSQSGTAPTYKITTVTVTAPKGDSDSGTSTIFFENSGVTDPIKNHCVLSADARFSKPCGCLYSWQETNLTSGNAVPVTRNVQTRVSNVQTSIVVCPLPKVYGSEIANGTILKISVIPMDSNADSFSMRPYNYTKGNTSSSASFQDIEGRAFQNVFRYSCYEKFKRGMTIKNKLAIASNPVDSAEVRRIPMASQFCVAKIDDNSSSAEGCEGMPEPEFSAQSYYYNLFIRSTDLGGINAENERYSCPKVTPSLAERSENYWPLDTTFSLALNASAEFPVGVEAPSRISIPGDAATQSSSCFGSADSGNATGEDAPAALLSSCLGFAAKPNSDGSCPYFRDSKNQLRLTYRLRRFVALYPPTFDTTGKMAAQPPALDQILVVDRPIQSVNADPVKPYTMRGPKPCPFAYYDHKKATNADPKSDARYVATNHSSWNGKNIDGIHFPFEDSLSNNSCSAVIPVPDTVRGILHLGTIHKSNPILYDNYRYVRPVKAWAPHYEEDTDFQACAPLADPYREAPLHMSRNDEDAGNIAWCAESYPSHNTAVTQGKPAHVGKTFRAVLLSQGKLDFTRFPLQADDVSIQKALQKDSTYACTVSYDGGGSKTGKSTPTEGCCGTATSLRTGKCTTVGCVDSAHLEPTSTQPNKCLIPVY